MECLLHGSLSVGLDVDIIPNNMELRSHPIAIPSFYGLLNAWARPYIPRFSAQQMDLIHQIQMEELEEDSDEEVSDIESDHDTDE